ncbi:MAG: WbqC family protein [Bacteroidales bacterium]|nr:WbqC family protein [Bacteroidales bacterium]
MKPVLLSIAYLPPVSWMAVALQSDKIALEVHETYPKQTFRNRCNIATASGILSLTIPVKRINGNHTKTCDIHIDNSKNWQLLHWRSIVTAYNKSPYFLYYRDQLEPIFLKKHDLLIDFNRELFDCILKALKIKTIDVFYTTEYEMNPDSVDLRNSFHPKYALRNISCILPRYMQTFEEFHDYLPDLSIIDLLFNIGPDALPYLASTELSIQEQINAAQDIQS